MPLTLEADPDTELFTTMVSADLVIEDEPPLPGKWQSETMLAMLAYEIARYDRPLTDRLVALGRGRCLAL